MENVPQGVLKAAEALCLACLEKPLSTLDAHWQKKYTDAIESMVRSGSIIIPEFAEGDEP